MAVADYCEYGTQSTPDGIQLPLDAELLYFDGKYRKRHQKGKRDTLEYLPRPNSKRLCGSSTKLKMYGGDLVADDLELFPLAQEMGFYGERKSERRPSAPTLPSVVLRSDPRFVITLKEPNIVNVPYHAAESTRSPNHQIFDMVTLLDSALMPARHRDTWDRKLNELMSLETGWDSYNAPAPSLESIRSARTFLKFLQSVMLEPSALNPSSVGGVGFTFRKGKMSAYLEFRNTGNAHIAFMGVGKPRIEKVIQNVDGYMAIMIQVEKHLNEQDA